MAMTKRALVLAVAALAGCASGVSPTEQFPNGPATASVRVSRPFAAGGMLIPSPVYVNGVNAGLIPAGGEIVVSVPAGKIAVSSNNSAVARTTALPGYEYMFQVTMPLQLWIVSPDFEVRFVGSHPTSTAPTAGQGQSPPTTTSPLPANAAGPAAVTRFAYASEKFARTQQCTPRQAAVLRSAAPDVESFDVPCVGGSTLKVSCGLGACRVE